MFIFWSGDIKRNSGDANYVDGVIPGLPFLFYVGVAINPSLSWYYCSKSYTLQVFSEIVKERFTDKRLSLKD
jgi:hypothetical protein